MRIVVVHGPPGSGKSFYVKNNVKEKDMVLDIDGITSCLFPKMSRGASDYFAKRISIFVRKAVFEKAINNCIDERVCYFITCSQDKEFLEELVGKLGAEIVHIDTPKHICRQRILSDETRVDKKPHLDFLERYFENI